MTNNKAKYMCDSILKSNTYIKATNGGTTFLVGLFWVILGIGCLACACLFVASIPAILSIVAVVGVIVIPIAAVVGFVWLIGKLMRRK